MKKIETNGMFDIVKTNGGLCYEVSSIHLPDGDVDTIDFAEICESESQSIFDSLVESVDLSSCTETYPQITTLKIPSFIMVKMRNSIFPNLYRVINDRGEVSYGMYSACNYISLRFEGYELMNVYKREDESISLKKISMIADYAFEGCRSSHVLDTEDVTLCHEHAFDGSIFEEMPRKNGVLMVGSILAYIDENAEVVDISDYTTLVRENAFIKNGKPIHIKKLVIHDSETLCLIKSELDVDTLVFNELKHSNAYDFVVQASKHNIRNFEVNNADFKTIDGILYNQSGTGLIGCPAGKTEEVIVPEGVTEIRKHSFSYTKISSVVFPDSLERIYAASFYHSEVRHVDFGKGIKKLFSYGCGCGAFESCMNLKYVEIPSQVEVIGSDTFYRSGLKSVTFHEGLRNIGENAFGRCFDLKTVELPATVERISNQNFEYVNNITLHSRVKNFFRYRTIQAPLITEVNMKDENGEMAKFYIPKGIYYTSASKLEKLFCAGQISVMQKIQMNICNITAVKQEIAIRMYDDNPDNQSNNAYLKRVSLSIAQRYLRDNCQDSHTDKLVKLLSKDLMTVSSLKKLLALSEETGNPTISTYILEAIERKGGKKNLDMSFRI